MVLVVVVVGGRGGGDLMTTAHHDMGGSKLWQNIMNIHENGETIIKLWYRNIAYNL